MSEEIKQDDVEVIYDRELSYRIRYTHNSTPSASLYLDGYPKKMEHSQAIKEIKSLSKENPNMLFDLYAFEDENEGLSEYVVSYVNEFEVYSKMETDNNIANLERDVISSIDMANTFEDWLFAVFQDVTGLEYAEYANWDLTNQLDYLLFMLIQSKKRHPYIEEVASYLYDDYIRMYELEHGKALMDLINNSGNQELQWMVNYADWSERGRTAYNILEYSNMNLGQIASLLTKVRMAAYAEFNKPCKLMADVFAYDIQTRNFYMNIPVFPNQVMGIFEVKDFVDGEHWNRLKVSEDSLPKKVRMYLLDIYNKQRSDFEAIKAENKDKSLSEKMFNVGTAGFHISENVFMFDESQKPKLSAEFNVNATKLEEVLPENPNWEIIS